MSAPAFSAGLLVMPRPTSDASRTRLHSHPLDPTTAAPASPRPRASARHVARPTHALQTPPHVTDAILAALYAGRLPQSPMEGMPELREALAARLARRHGIDGLRADDLTMTNGATHALFLSFAALLAPGDEVIVAEPGWPAIAESIRLAGGVPVAVPLHAELGWSWRSDDVERAITSRTAAICVDTPHNPTGAVLARDVVLALVDVARRHDLWIVSDELFDDLVFAPRRHHSPCALAGAESHRMVGVFGCARTQALGGLRVGYVVSRSLPVRDRLRRLLRGTTSGVSPLAQWAAHAAVIGRDDTVEVCDAHRHRRDRVLDALAGIPGLHPVTPAGTPYVWATIDPSLYPRLEVADAESLVAALSVDGIDSVPGARFGASTADAIRLTVPAECSPEYLARLRDALM